MTIRPEPSTSPTRDEISANATAVLSIDELARDGIFEEDAETDIDTADASAKAARS